MGGGFPGGSGVRAPGARGGSVCEWGLWKYGWGVYVGGLWGSSSRGSRWSRGVRQPASASICERINSEFEFVKDRRRNRLGHDKANLLVGLFHNLRLLKRMKKPQYTEPTIAWNDDVEKTGVTTYAIGSPATACALLK